MGVLSKSVWLICELYPNKRLPISRLLAVSLARQCQLLPDDSAGLDTPAELAGIGHIMH
jgi:hypothetical protein